MAMTKREWDDRRERLVGLDVGFYERGATRRDLPRIGKVVGIAEDDKRVHLMVYADPTLEPTAAPLGSRQMVLFLPYSLSGTDSDVPDSCMEWCRPLWPGDGEPRVQTAPAEAAPPAKDQGPQNPPVENDPAADEKDDPEAEPPEPEENPWGSDGPKMEPPKRQEPQPAAQTSEPEPENEFAEAGQDEFFKQAGQWGVFVNAPEFKKAIETAGKGTHGWDYNADELMAFSIHKAEASAGPIVKLTMYDIGTKKHVRMFVRGSGGGMQALVQKDVPVTSKKCIGLMLEAAGKLLAANFSVEKRTDTFDQWEAMAPIFSEYRKKIQDAVPKKRTATTTKKKTPGKTSQKQATTDA